MQPWVCSVRPKGDRTPVPLLGVTLPTERCTLKGSTDQGADGMTEPSGRQVGLQSSLWGLPKVDPPKEPSLPHLVLRWAPGSFFCLSFSLSLSPSCSVKGIIDLTGMTERTTGDNDNANMGLAVTWSSAGLVTPMTICSRAIHLGMCGNSASWFLPISFFFF